MLSGLAAQKVDKNKAPKATLSGSSELHPEVQVFNSQLESGSCAASSVFADNITKDLRLSNESWNSGDVLIFSNLNQPNNRPTIEDDKSMSIDANATKPKCCTMF